jgi:transposase
MAPNFIECDREQAFLMPPSLRDWVPEDHLVWTILGAVEEMDLSDFYADYRADGHGRPAYDPKMMVALLLYAYAKGNRSSRGVERECQEDVAYRVICANHVPDHSTIAEFRRRHETALAELFTSVLSLCQKAGLITYRTPVSYSFGGFRQPVDNPPTVNTGRAGRTYPIKFQVRDQNGALVTSLAAVSSITHKPVACGAFSGDPTDALETTATGGTSLRFEGDQFIYNWQTPTTAGCYELFVTLADGSVHSANFSLR